MSRSSFPPPVDPNCLASLKVHVARAVAATGGAEDGPHQRWTEQWEAVGWGPTDSALADFYSSFSILCHQDQRSGLTGVAAVRSHNGGWG